MRIDFAARAVTNLSRGVFLARRALAHPNTSSTAPHSPRSRPTTGRRNILFITTDQQRYDSLGITGHPSTRTPHIDALARSGLLYRRAHVQNVVCMPSRATMITGQHPLTHGVVANGIALDDASPNVARTLGRAGYRTAIIGKAHFDPHLDPWLRHRENRLAAERSNGPWRGFDHVELATHGPLGGHHYADWLWSTHPGDVTGFGAVLAGVGGGETNAPEVKHNPIARERYHTDWIADRTITWLRDASRDDAPFFCWMSFPDPHHPFDPPLDEVRKRGDFRARPLPNGHPGSPAKIRSILARKPRHWLDWYEGRHTNPEGGPACIPSRFEHDQLREVDHMIEVENELIDEAIGRVMDALTAFGLDDDTDVFFTSDHGDLQGDFGLLFKGPYHVDALMRVPFVWRPAPSAHIPSAVIDEPVGHVDLAPTFCAIAGIDTPSAMQGTPLPLAPTARRERVITTFDSNFASIGMHLRTIYREGIVCTVYEPSTHDVGGRFPIYSAVWLRNSRLPRYDGTEGELYDLRNDPRQWENRWSDPTWRSRRDDLVADLRANLPPARPIPLVATSPT